MTDTSVMGDSTESVRIYSYLLEIIKRPWLFQMHFFVPFNAAIASTRGGTSGTDVRSKFRMKGLKGGGLVRETGAYKAFPGCA
jgi:hypothetical protein